MPGRFDTRLRTLPQLEVQDISTLEARRSPQRSQLETSAHVESRAVMAICLLIGAVSRL